MKKFAILLVLILMGMVFSTSTMLDRVQSSISDLCSSLKSLLPVAAMLMIVVAGVIYTAGQIMGAETRARANVWATAALTGALMGLLIYAIAPPVLGSVYQQDFDLSGQTFCP